MRGKDDEDPLGRRREGVWAVTVGVGALMCAAAFFVVGGLGWVTLNLPIDQGQWLGAAYGAFAAVGPLVAGWSGVRAIRNDAAPVWARVAGGLIVLLALALLALAVALGGFLFTWEGLKFQF